MTHIFSVLFIMLFFCVQFFYRNVQKFLPGNSIEVVEEALQRNQTSIVQSKFS